MPLHPTLEGALNRIAILGDIASDEIALLDDAAALERMVALSVVSVSDPQRFQRALRAERAAAIAARRGAGSGGAGVSSVTEEDDDAVELSPAHAAGDAAGMVGAMATAGPDGRARGVRTVDLGRSERRRDEARRRREMAGGGGDCDGDDEEEEEEDLEEAEEAVEEEDAEEARAAAAERDLHREAHRIKAEMSNMSGALLHSLAMGIEFDTRRTTANTKQVGGDCAGDDAIIVSGSAKEPDVHLSNVALVRFVLSILSDSGIATTLRVPLLQGDLPLLVRSVLRCCEPTPDINNNNNNKMRNSSAPTGVSPQQPPPLCARDRNAVVFLALDMIATMCSDSAACRLAFVCCVPLICAVLRACCVAPTTTSSTAASSSAGGTCAGNTAGAAATATAAVRGATTKKPVVFVRSCGGGAAVAVAPSTISDGAASNVTLANAPVSAAAAAAATSASSSPAAAAANATTEADVIFAGAATLETLLFHCVEAVEAFVGAGGIAVLISLFRQSAAADAAQEHRATTTTTTTQQSSATDTTAFIKRVLIHVRTCGAITEEEWAAMLAPATTSSSGSGSLLPLFGRQGDVLAVDELKWALTGGVRLGMRRP